MKLIFYPSAISNQVTPFLELPESSQVALPFMSWYPKVIPINAALVSVFSIPFYISIYADGYDKLKEVNVYLYETSIVPEKRLRNSHFLIYSRRVS